MSDTTFPATVFVPIRTLYEQIFELSQQAAYLQDAFASDMAGCVFGSVNNTLKAMFRQLIEATVAQEGDEREIHPLPNAEPYFMPQALAQVARYCAVTVPVLFSLGLSATPESRLAIDCFAGRLLEIGKTAGYLCETVLEELPPLPSAIPANAPIVAV